MVATMTMCPWLFLGNNHDRMSLPHRCDRDNFDLLSLAETRLQWGQGRMTCSGARHVHKALRRKLVSCREDLAIQKCMRA